MDAVAPPGSSSALSGRLLLMLAAAAFVIATLTGNSFSMHVGMAATASADHVAGALDRVPHVAAEAATPPASVSSEMSDRAAPVTAGSDPQHLMHLIGACLAVLAAAAVLIWLSTVRRALMGGHPAVTGVPRATAPTLASSWSPPAPSPPTSSPVIRT